MTLLRLRLKSLLKLLMKKMCVRENVCKDHCVSPLDGLTERN